MNKLTFIAPIAAALLLAAATTARAETMDDMRFGDLMAPKMIDKNKDGMVSRAEFVEMMGKMFDAKAKKMGVKSDRMSMAEFNEILMYLKAGS